MRHQLNFAPGGLQRQPGGDVGVVVHVGDDDLVALAEHLADAEADQADERGGVHAEADFRRAVGVDQQRDALARLGDRLVDRDAAAIAAAALHIVGDQMMGHRVEHALRDLRAGGIVEEDEVAGLLQRREHARGSVSTGNGRGVWVPAGCRVLVHGSLLEVQCWNSSGS